MENNRFLDQPLSKLNLSETFCRQTESMGYHRLSEIVGDSPENILKKKGFSYAWLGELSELLNKHKLLHLLQPIQGKIDG